LNSGGTTLDHAHEGVRDVVGVHQRNAQANLRRTTAKRPRRHAFSLRRRKLPLNGLYAACVVAWSEYRNEEGLATDLVAFEPHLDWLADIHRIRFAINDIRRDA